MHLNMNSWPVLSLLYTLIINILLTILITLTKCKHHHHTVIKHQNHHSRVHNHYHHHHHHNHNNIHHHKHKIKNYDKSRTLNNTSYNMTTNCNTTLIYSTNITTEEKTNTSDYYYCNGTSGPLFYYSIRETTRAPNTINYRKSAYNMAGRIVRGIGAIGSANVVRGAIALFQRIRHPWKDKIFGTDPTTKKPIYCTHHLCLSGGSQRGSHHGSYRIAQRKPWLFNRKPLKQVTVKIIIDSTNKQISNELKNSEKIESLTQDSSLHLSPAPPSSSLKAYLYHPEQSNTLVGHEQLPYSFHNPWLHYEVGENNHFESFGKQEHGKIETAPVKPKVYYFNPLLHRSRITNYVRNLQQTFNTSHCHLCKRPLDTNHESIKLNNKNIKDDNNDDDDLISRLKNDKLSLLSMRRKWYWANKLRNIRNSLLEQLKPEKHPKHIATYKRTYIDLLLRALTESNALVPILQSPKYLSLIEKLVSSSTGNQMDMLQSSATKKPLLLLPYYKNSKDSEN